MTRKNKIIILTVSIIIIVLWLKRKKVIRTIIGTATIPSDMLILNIASFEGFSANPYYDPPGSNKQTIGYGHQILPGETFTSITKEDALDILIKDVNKAADEVIRLTDVSLTQGQLDALTDFVFNFGAGAFESSTLRRLVNLNRPAEEIANELRKWVYVDGRPSDALASRREYDIRVYNA